MKKLAIITVTLIALTFLTSITVAAQNAEFYSYSLNDYELSSDTLTNVNTIDSNLFYALVTDTANYKGCKVTLHVNQLDLPSAFDKPKMAIIINSDDSLKQIVNIDINSATFDWDTILAKAKWQNAIGLVNNISIISSEDITITGVDILIPQKADTKKADLAAGAGCTDLAVPIRG